MIDFDAGIAALNLTLDSAEKETLLRYIALMQKWNRTYNLTAIRHHDEMIVKHLFDSLAIQPFLQGQRHIDVGTGAGLPGIPLAISLPQQHFTLLDSNSKKTRFLRHCVAKLQLANVDVVHSRVEDYQPTQTFDTILTRAFSQLDNILSLTQHLAHQQTRFLAMKGQLQSNELNCIKPPYQLDGTPKITVPGCNEERHLILISQGTESN